MCGKKRENGGREDGDEMESEGMCQMKWEMCFYDVNSVFRELGECLAENVVRGNVKWKCNVRGGQNGKCEWYMSCRLGK